MFVVQLSLIFNFVSLFIIVLILMCVTAYSCWCNFGENMIVLKPNETFEYKPITMPGPIQVSKAGIKLKLK